MRHPEEHAATPEQVERRSGELEREAGEYGVGGVGGRRKWREILNVEVVGVKSCALVVRLEGKDDSWVEDLVQRWVVGNIQPLPLGAFE